jgi:hypothetical protein
MQNTENCGSPRKLDQAAVEIDPGKRFKMANEDASLLFLAAA